MSQETKKYLIEEALGELNSNASKKFTESSDVSINLGIDASKSDQNVEELLIFLMEMVNLSKLQYLLMVMKLHKQKKQEQIK